MDVGNPSNFSRILDIYDGDYERIHRDMTGYSFSDAEIAESMKEVYDRNGYVMDPHGATAYRALRRNLSSGEKGIFLATAHPSKFSKTVESITGVKFTTPMSAPTEDVSEHHPTPRITPSLPALKKFLLSAT